MKTKTKIELVNYAIERLKELENEGVYGCDLHSEIFNREDYFVYYDDAEEWLAEHIGIFDSLKMVRDYDIEMFGEVTTDLSDSVKVCNTVVYILGEEILNSSSHLRSRWDNTLTETDINEIIEELKASISVV